MNTKSLIFAVTFVASLSIAGTASAQKSKFEGFYAGAQAGYTSTTEEISVLGITIIEETADGFGGGGFVGFGGTNGNLYGSIEVEVGYDGAEWSGTILGVPADVEGQLTYGVGFRIGGVVGDDLLLYGRIGYIRTNFETTLTYSTVDTSGSLSIDTELDGFRFGGGVEAMLADNIGVRAEYTYTIYDVDDFTISGFKFEDDVDQHLFRIGVAYYF